MAEDLLPREAVPSRTTDYLEGLLEGFVAYDECWRMTYMNAAAERLLGRRREDVLGKTWHQAFPHAVGNGVDQMYQRVMASRNPERMELEYAHYGRWFEISASPVRTGGVAVYFRDTTAANRSRHRLLVLQSLTASLAAAQSTHAVADVIMKQALPALQAEVGVVAMLTPDGRKLRNIGFEGVSQETQSDWEEYPLESPVPVAEAALTGSLVLVPTREARNRRYPVLAAVHGPDKGGPVVALPLKVEGRLQGVLGLCFPEDRPFDEDDLAFLQALADQTAVAVERARLALEAREALVAQRHAIETQREQDRRKDEFLATLAHELRNPLAPIRNAVQILERPGTPEDVQQQSREILRRQLQQMVRLIDDLLDVSRITRGKLQLRMETVCLSEVLENAIETARPHMRGHELRLALPEEPIHVDGDPVRLTQIFANLLNNACKFTDKGGHISVSAGRTGSRVAVRVADSGIGIAPEHLPELFKMFSQATPALERAQGGLGIGLALSRGLVELHGGTIEARSGGLGHGSEFVVTLPVVEPRPARRGERSPALSLGERARRILVVDDVRDSAESLGALLRMSGSEVRLAHDGREALSVAAAWKPEVVLLDLGLPKMNGYEVCRALRAAADGAQLVIIAITGWGQEEDRRRSTQAGFDAHLVKPVDLAVLCDLLASIGGSARASTVS